ncbi:MAG: hypothetical protein M3O85_03110 [Acidobacteriota bacterium]|nr:hypothetical protein [Acidobacteriota bacterium]
MASKQSALQLGKADQKEIEPIPTAGEIFPDGSAVELIRNDGRLDLVGWDGQRATPGHAEHQGRRYLPPPIDPTVFQALRLPARIEPYGSTRQLFQDVCEVFTRHKVLEEPARLLTHFVFSTWLADCLPSAPCLWIVSPGGTDGGALLRLLAALTRRSLLLSEVTRAGFLALPLHLQPTLLIEQHKLPKALQSLLVASRTKGLGVPVSGELRGVFGPRVICTGHPLERFLSEGTIQISLTPQAGLLAVDEDAIEDIAHRFQPRLLAYRLTQQQKARASKFDVADLSAPLRLLARSLGACVVDEPELQNGLTPLLREQDDGVRAENSASMEAVAVEAVLFYVHEGGKGSVYVNEIADAANGILQNRGEPFGVEDRAVGGVLNRLGLFTTRLSGRGRGLRLQQSVRRKVHELARQYEVLTAEAKFSGCEDCSAGRQALGLASD